ncbi:MAG: hypothetical protein Q9191_003888 [Dirinaria sp. TL-2023a]
MPPRKRARLSSRAVSTLSGNAAELGEEPPTSPGKKELLSDVWTDEQEALLLKSMIRWKPVGPFSSLLYNHENSLQTRTPSLMAFEGIHRHFRMFAIRENLRNHGYTSSSGEHLTIPGIWSKLQTLYNLEALDERENDANMASLEGKGHAEEPYSDFDLPSEEYKNLMFDRRLASQGSRSPSSLSSQFPSEQSSRNQRQSTVEDTDDPRSSPASFMGNAAVRGTRSKPTGKSQLQSVSVPTRTRGNKASAKEEQKDDGEGPADTKDVKAAKGTQNAAKSKSNRRQSTRKR